VAAVRRTGKHAQGTICYTISPLHTAGEFVEMAESCWIWAAIPSASRTWRRC
jgi:pyruvate/oxaloacetate carboxyltransferase